jgi:hypothetical protein
MNIDNIVERVSDVLLRDKIRRQMEIQNQTISNLESLNSSLREKISSLTQENEALKAELKTARSASIVSVPDLFESDGVLWSMKEKNGQQIFRPHCPQCEAPLDRTADFVKCTKCSYEEILTCRRPSKMP